MAVLFHKILPLPQRFDANEWFIVLNLIVGYGLVMLLPRRFPRVISILVCLFSVSMALIVDHSIASPPLDLYDINDYKNYELFDVITYFIYSPYALLNVYLFDRWNPKGLRFAAFIVGLSVLSVLFEWLANLCHVFRYNNWNLLYSFAVYLIVTTLHFRFFLFLRRYFQMKSAAF